MAVNAPEDVVNQALDLIGYPRAISDINEGTRASRVMLRLYGQSRDEALRAKDWPFARRYANLSLIRSAYAANGLLYGGGVWSTTYALPPYLYEYNYPSDCLYLRYVRSSPATVPTFDPAPVLFTVANDPSVLNSNSQASEVILTYMPAAIAVYTGRVIDVTTWEPMFVDVVTQTLAKKAAVVLSQSPDLLKMKVQESAQDLETAAMREE